MTRDLATFVNLQWRAQKTHCYVQASCVIFCNFLTICILQTRFSTCSDSAMESIESVDVAMNFAETSAGSADRLESISGKCGDHGKQH